MAGRVIHGPTGRIRAPRIIAGGARARLLIVCALVVMTLGLPWRVAAEPLAGRPAAFTGIHQWGLAADAPQDESLVRDSAIHRIDLLWSGVRHPINSSASLAALGLSGHPIVVLPSPTVQAMPQGSTLRLRLTHGLIFPLSPIDSGHARLTLSAPALAPGTTLSIQGTGFLANEQLQVRFAGIASTAVANASGALTLTLGLPPGLPVGDIARLYVYGVVGGSFAVEPVAAIASAPAPRVRVAPLSIGQPGTIIIGGDGFAPGEQVALFVNEGVSATLVAADASGGFNGANLVLPSYLAGRSFRILAYGQSSRLLASIQVAGNPAADGSSGHAGGVAAGLSLNRYTFGVGGLVLVDGTNFGPGEAVRISLNGVAVVTATAGSDGAFQRASFTLPSSLGAGVFPLEALGAGSKRIARTSLQVRVLHPSIVLDPAEAAPGGLVSVRGTGFATREGVTLALNAQALVSMPQEIVTTGAGAFAATFAVPPSAQEGLNTVAATGSISRGAAPAALRVRLSAPAAWYLAGGTTLPGNRTRIALLNPTGQAVRVDASFMFTVGAPIPYSVRVPAGSRATIDVNEAVGPGRHVFTKLVADGPIGAEQTVYRDGKDFSSSIGVSAPLTAWYLAEGYTGLTFREQISLFNPSTVAARVHLRLLPANGTSALAVDRMVGAQSGMLVDVNALAPNQSVAAMVTSDRPIVVNRLLTFGAGGYGATEGTGIRAPASAWLFAEGSTLNGFETFLTILNPSPTRQAVITASFFDRAGLALGSHSIVLDPLRRGTIHLNDLIHASGIATVLTSTVPVVAERPLYFGAPNAAIVGGSDVFGRNGGGVSWLFPEGETGGTYREFLLLQNPATTVATVQISFFGTHGLAGERTITLPPMSRTTLDVPRDVPSLPPGEHGTWVRGISGPPIIAEQSIYTDGFKQGDGVAGIAQ